MRQAYDYWQDQPGNYPLPRGTSLFSSCHRDLAPTLRRGGCSQIGAEGVDARLIQLNAPSAPSLSRGERARPEAPGRESRFSGPHQSPPHLDSLLRGGRLSRFRSNDRLVFQPNALPGQNLHEAESYPRCIRGVDHRGRPRHGPARSRTETSASRRSPSR